jgi:hypothetical protein
MKHAFALVAALVLCCTAFAQTPPSLSSLSATPSAPELAEIFINTGGGRVDPFASVPLVVSRGDKAVPALQAVLTNPALVGTSSGNDTLHPKMLFAVLALEGIGTQAAYIVLTQTVQTHPDVEVRGEALNALAVTYHGADQVARFVPDKELIHLFLQNLDDTTQSVLMGRPLGQIARAGLITWLGRDFGEPQGELSPVMFPSSSGSSPATTITAAASHEAWWQSNAAQISWKDSLGRFALGQ